MRVAIIGCGAVTEKKHLPALAASELLTVTALVDLDFDRARRLADQYGIATASRDLAGLADRADIGLVAVHHHLHARIAVDLMLAGLHPFVEKPLATNMEDVGQMLEVATKTGRRIGVGLVRRQYSSFAFVKSVLDQGWLGAIRSFDFREGGIYNWPVATDATFRRETQGGVLFDTGAHTLDMLLAWLGPFRDVSYADDSRGGVDANCLLELTLESGVRGVVELSRTRNLRNTCIIRGDRGEIEVGVGPSGPVSLRVGRASLTATPHVETHEDVSPLDLTRRQLEEFAEALQTGADCHVFAEHTQEPIRLYDRCRSAPQPLELPWESWSDSVVDRLDGKTVLVLGGTGFIGGRLVEVLAEQSGARVRVLSRAFSRLSNVSRFAVEVCPGDVTDEQALARAMAGCDVVVNCTYGRGSRDVAHRVNVDVVTCLVRAASAAGVSRVVHLSTVSAYGVPPDGMLREEDSHRAPRSHVYGYTKWEGERAGLALAEEIGLDFRVLQPTVVYGPGAPSWTVNPLRMLRTGRVVLVNGGDGLCNALYVDDLVQAILRAATADEGVRERFLISGAAPVTWRDFYGAYEAMLGEHSTVSMTEGELATARADNKRRSRTTAQLASILRDPAVFRRLARLPIVDKAKSLSPRSVVELGKAAVLGGRRMAHASTGKRPHAEKPIHIPAQMDAQFQAAKTHVSIAKAERLLGYRPVFSFMDGIERTEQWARWANLLP